MWEKEPKLLDVCTNCCEVFLARPCLWTFGIHGKSLDSPWSCRRGLQAKRWDCCAETAFTGSNLAWNSVNISARWFCRGKSLYFLSFLHLPPYYRLTRQTLLTCTNHHHHQADPNIFRAVGGSASLWWVQGGTLGSCKWTRLRSGEWGLGTHLTCKMKKEAWSCWCRILDMSSWTMDT